MFVAAIIDIHGYGYLSAALRRQSSPPRFFSPGGAKSTV
jgi:hypothetical protein